LAASAVAVQPGVHVDVDQGGVTVERHNTTGMTSDVGQIVRLKDISGLSVYNTNNKSLGKIEDLVIDMQSGKIRYAVLSFGGFLGMGDKLFAIPWQKLSFISKGTTSSGTVSESYVVLNVSKETLKNAPGFDKKSWPDIANASWNSTIEQFYGTSRQARGQRTPQR
jgi:sporulation protein YlmC with PRC-barrel domain